MGGEGKSFSPERRTSSKRGGKGVPPAKRKLDADGEKR